MYLVFVYLLLPLLVLSAQHQELFRAPSPRSLAVRRPSSAFGDPRAENIEELALTDIVLTASVDGKFHAFNRTNGQLKWSMRDVQSNPQSYPLLHELVRTDHTSRDIHEDDVESDDIYIIEPQSGEIFVVPPGSSASTPLERLPFTIPQLVEMSPFRFVGDDQRMFLGRKETSIVTLDLDTGSVISVYADRCMWDEANATAAGETLDLTGVLDESDDFESKVPQGKIRSQRREIHIGRTDYHVAVHIRGRGIVQNLSFSVYGPNNVDRERQLAWTRTQDDRYLQPLTDGQIMSFRTSKDPGDPLEWSNKLSHPTVAVFDVLTISSRRDPIVLLQPRPPLTELFTSPSHRSQIASLPDSTYVGLIGESLYAMSHLNYPLVAFSRRGAGRRRVALRAGSELVLPDDEDNTCSTLECLVGTHQSEYAASSRLSRLLDSGTKLHIDGANHDPDPGVDIPTLNPNSVQPSPLPRSAPPPRQWRASWVQGAGALLLGLIGYLSFYSSSVPLQQSSSDEAPVDVAPDLKPITPHETTMPTASQSVPTPKTIHSKPVSKSSEDTDPEDDLPADSDGVGKSRRKQKPRNRGRGKKGKSRVALDEGELPVTYTEEGTMDKSDDFVRVDLPQTLNSVDFTVAGAALPIAQNTPDIPAAFPPRPMESTLTVFEGSESALGFGSHGTVVYRGSFQGRAVAVKRLLQDFVTVASREVALLQESDDHPNVIRYFYQESRNNFLYIALELCPASLEDILRHPNIFPEIAAVFHPKKALAQITAGLQHLHSLKIVHRDIKPQNILISQAKNGVHRMLISDFGLCKKLGTDETSFLPTQHGPLGAGTVGWRAPEILRGEVNLDVSTIDLLGSMDQEENSSTVGSLGGPGLTSGSGKDHGNRMRLTKSVDIFALGCLFFYTLTCGEHPFGGPFDRESNILKDEKDLSWLERLGEEGEEVSDLIGKMLNPQPKLRLDTTACLIHPFFWTPARRLGFLQDASDRFEIMGRDPPEPGLISLETDAYGVVGVDWHRRLDKTLIDNLGKFRKYNGKSVQDLLRALRNKKHHYQDLPENVKRHLGPLPEGFLNYFTRRFPRLFLHVYYVIATSSLRHEPMFKSYFELHDV